MPKPMRAVWMVGLLGITACADEPEDEPNVQIDQGDGSALPDGRVVVPPRDGQVGSDQGSRPDVGPARDDLGPVDDGGEPPPDDAAVGIDAGADAGEDPHGPRPARLVAAITLAETPQGDAASANVAFVAPSPFDSPAGCVVLPVDPNTALPAARGYHGGTVTVTGVVGEPRVFAPSGDAAAGFTYASVGGDRIFAGPVVRAVGDGGPHFRAFDVQVSRPPTVQIRDPGNASQHDSDSPLDVRWDAGEAESLLITLFPVEGFDADPMRGNWAFCGVPDTGQFQIPAATVRQVADNPVLGQPAVVGITRTRLVLDPADPAGDQVVLSASTSAGVLVGLLP